MTEGVIWKQLLGFALPLMVGLIFQQLYNTVDAIVVGKFVSMQAFAAVGSTSSIINMLVGLCAGLSSGAGVVISQSYGTRDYDKLSDSVHTTMLLTFILSVIITIVGVLIVPPMLRLMATPADVFDEARGYLTIYFAGIAGLLVYNMASGILRAVGDSRHPLYFLIFSALVNIVFDLLFVLVFHLGVNGVAYATILSQFLSAVLVLYTLSRTDAPYALHWKKLRIDREMFRRILSIGMPSGIQQALTAFSNIFVQSYVNVFGSACMAGWAAYGKLDIFIVIPLQSLALASTTFVGQNYGSARLSRARQGVKTAMLSSAVITAALSALLILFAEPLVRLFNDDAEAITYGVLFITFAGPFYITMCPVQIYAGSLRGTGHAAAPMLIMLASFVAFRQLYLYVGGLCGGGLTLVALAYPVGWVLCAVLMTIVYFRSDVAKAKDDV